MKYLYIIIFITALYTLSCTTDTNYIKDHISSNPGSSLKNESGIKQSHSKKNVIEGNVTENTGKLLLKKAKQAYNSESYSECLKVARELRIKYPYSPEFLEALYLSGLAEIKLDEPYRARYFFKRILSLKKETNLVNSAESNSYVKELTFKTQVLLGKLLYREHLYDESLKYYLDAIKGKEGDEISGIFLRIAEINYYQKKNIHNARYYFLKINPNVINAEEKSLYTKLKEKLEWENILPEKLGINDSNISAVAVDGDDLWIGTWNGGVARYNISMVKSIVFKEGSKSLVPKTVRTIEVTKKRVWVGSFNGLSYYSKASSKWYSIKVFSNPEPIKVESVKNVNGKLYIGTLGNGLWSGTESGIRKFRRVDFPSQFINCLNYFDNYLLIGTMDMGLFFMNLQTGRIVNIQKLYAGFSTLNITTIITNGSNDLWIGTYGEGLFHWIRDSNRMEIYSRENKRIRDDWILSSVKTKKGLYFGTFGGGLIYVDKKGNLIKNIGLKDGLSSLDISASAYMHPLLILGTLGMGITIFYEDIKE